MKRAMRNRLRKLRKALIGTPEELILIERDGLFRDTLTGNEYSEEEVAALNQKVVIIKVRRVKATR